MYGNPYALYLAVSSRRITMSISVKESQENNHFFLKFQFAGVLLAGE